MSEEPVAGPSRPPNGKMDGSAPIESPELKPEKRKKGRRHPLPWFKTGGLPTSEMHTTAWTMVSGEELPTVSEDDQAKMKRWIERDAAYERQYAIDRTFVRSEISRSARMGFAAGDWLGPHQAVGVLEGPPKIRFPQERLSTLAAGKAGQRAARNAKLSREQLAAIADQGESLVPVRLDVEHGEFKLRDVFTWNLDDKHLTPDLFASTLLDDLKIPEPQHRQFKKDVVNSITEQLEEARKGRFAANVMPPDAHPGDDSTAFWEKWRRGERKAAPVSLKESSSTSHDELRIVIKARLICTPT